jgi:cysteine-S-conjugate beta-lyase
MQYDFDNFDRIIDRRNTCCIKHDPASRGKPDDVLPMWVADMDFATPPCVSDALVACARHGIYGYSEPDAGYFAAVRDWFERRFDWHIEKKWLAITPGVVNALCIAIRALTQPDDGVLIQQPVYYPFELCARHTGRKLLVNELVYNDGRYSIDFDDFETKIKEAKLFILCSPHNPVGRVWTRDELVRMGEICLRHDVIVISDEIHQDFVFSGHRHLVFAALDKRFADITITCTSPSKTFNLAGLLHANIFIENEAMRSKFNNEYARCGLSQPGIMGLVSCKAAYGGGAEWLDALIEYLAGNMALIGEFAQTNIPKIKLVPPEGTYLAWLDCTELGLSAKELDAAITHKAKLWLNSGAQFGLSGAGFARMNIACPRPVVRIAMERLKNVQ